MSYYRSKGDELKQPLSAPVAEQDTTVPAQKQHDVTFEFTGSGNFSVRGNVTGIYYMFTGTGSKISVDCRDAGGMRGELLLKQISH